MEKLLFCLNCNKELGKRLKKYCSVDCRLAYERRKPNNYCEVCGEQLDKRHKKFCSKECDTIYKTGKTQSDETKEKISKALKGNQYSKGNKWTDEQKLNHSARMTGVPKSDKWKKNMSKSQKGINNSMYGVPSPMTGKRHTPEVKKKLRLKRIQRIQECLDDGLQVTPNWNPKACDYFEEFDRDNNTQGQHARNGGEFNIKELGYWVDYINHDLKLIMEYDEQYHQSPKQKEKDILRQEEIQEYFPEYKFKRIKDSLENR